MNMQRRPAGKLSDGTPTPPQDQRNSSRDPSTTGLFSHAHGRAEADAATLKRRHADALARTSSPDAVAARARVAQWGQYSPRSRDDMQRGIRP
jgi:hypothetical protein